jgi:hypothetical protein
MKKEFPTPTELLDKEEKLMKDLGELLEWKKNYIKQ